MSSFCGSGQIALIYGFLTTIHQFITWYIPYCKELRAIFQALFLFSSSIIQLLIVFASFLAYLSCFNSNPSCTDIVKSISSYPINMICNMQAGRFCRPAARLLVLVLYHQFGGMFGIRTSVPHLGNPLPTIAPPSERGTKMEFVVDGKGTERTLPLFFYRFAD